MPGAIGVVTGTSGSVPVKPAFEVGGVDFSARKGHCLECTLVAKGRLLIGLFFRGRFLGHALPARILVRLRHRKLVMHSHC